MTGMYRLAVSFVGIALLCAPAFAEEPASAADWVDRGNAKFRQSRMIDALDAYRRADKLAPDSPQIAFNRGLAHYMLGETDKARELFNAALLTDDRRLEGRAKFNLGNCDYAGALSVQEENPRQAVRLLTNAINYYCDSLDLLPDNTDARKNMQMARQLIKQIEEQLEQQKQQQDQRDQNEQSEQEQQATTQPSRKDEQQPTSQPSEQEEQTSTQPAADEQQQQGHQGAEEQQQQGGEQAEQPDAARRQAEANEGEQEQREALKMSKEQAQRLLQAIRDKEQARRMQKAERRQRQPAQDGKDW